MRLPTLSAERFIASLSSFAGVLDFARHANPDRWKRGFARDLGVEIGARWDVAMIQHCGYWSQFDYETECSWWPIERALVPNDLAAFGVSRGLLRPEPDAGDIWLQYNPERDRFVRAGVIARVIATGVMASRAYHEVMSLEADTGDGGELGGGNVLVIVRRLWPSVGDAILRWTDAGPLRFSASVRLAA